MTTAETTRHRLRDAEITRLAGEIVLLSPRPEAAKAQGYFELAHSAT
jgi:hypothetical protein